MIKKVPKRAIPILPKGCTPFKPEQLVRQTVRTDLDRLDIYTIYGTIDEAIDQFKKVKANLMKKHGSDHSPIMLEADGPDYEGLDTFVFYHIRDETEAEARKRLTKIANAKIAWLNKKTGKRPRIGEFIKE